MEIRFCCDNSLVAGECEADGYAWTEYLNADNDQTDDGDYELIKSWSASEVCGNPTGVQARSLQGNKDWTHVSTDVGFYCVNSEQDDGACDDYEVRYCCPKYQSAECNLKGYAWTDWIDRDDPDQMGDIENLSALQPNTACRSPIATRAKDNSAGVADGTSDAVTHIDSTGFYCYNHEQPGGKPCSDFSVSFCCPTDEADVTCNDSGVCQANEWCLETSSGPTCHCGDDDFNIDWDSDDFAEFEDGTCLPLDGQAHIDAGQIEVGNCDEYGYAWTDLVSVSDPTTGDGDYEFIHNHPRGCDAPTGLRAVPNSAMTWPVHIDLGIGFW